MSVEENKAVVHRWFEEFWHAGNMDVLTEILHPDYVYGDGVSKGAHGVEANKDGYATWRGILPDIHFTIHELIAEGDTVVARWTAHGTHQGDWTTPIGTIPASGKVIVTPGTSIYHFRD